MEEKVAGHHVSAAQIIVSRVKSEIKNVSTYLSKNCVETTSKNGPLLLWGGRAALETGPSLGLVGPGANTIFEVRNGKGYPFYENSVFICPRESAGCGQRPTRSALFGDYVRVYCIVMGTIERKQSNNSIFSV